MSEFHGDLSGADKAASGVPEQPSDHIAGAGKMVASVQQSDNWHPSPDGSHEVSTGGGP